jgi:hypothetical protein
LRRIEIQKLGALFARAPNEHRAAPSDAGHLRLHNPDRKCRRDGSVYRISPLPQDTEPGFARKRMRRRDDTIGRHDSLSKIRRQRRCRRSPLGAGDEAA